MFNNIIEGILAIGNWCARIIYLHFLWLIFTILGLVVFGVFPATTGVFYVIRKWLEEDGDAPIFKNFYKGYKDHLVKANILGYILFAVGLFLYYDFSISKMEIGIPFLHFLILVIAFFYFIMLLYVFPVFVRYEFKVLAYFKTAFKLSISRPLETLAMIISMVILYYFFNIFPLFFFIGGVPLIAFPSMWFAHNAFYKIEAGAR